MGKRKVTVLVAGSWGTALASVLADHDYEVRLWTRHEEQAKEINEQHTNAKYLPDVKLSHQIHATTSLEEAMKDSTALVVVVPSSGMRELAREMKPWLTEQMLLIHAAKGFEMDTLLPMSQVLTEELGPYWGQRVTVLSGPSHAEEVIRRCPTTVVVSSADLQAAEAAQDLFINSYFRVYTNPDVVGVEVGGALKNIIALGAGMSDGLGFGDNAKAALMTRGLAEIARLGVAMGANPLTFAGLAGVGDLVVTCTSQHSRNWRAGSLLGKGHVLNEVLERMGMVVEGVKTTKAAYALSRRFNVAMPITDELYYVMFENKDPRAAVESLMGRGRTDELEEVAKPSSANWMRGTNE